MIALLEPVSASLGTTNMLVPLVLSDVSDEVARTRTRDGEGPSITWELGHLLDYRCQMLGLLGVETKRRFATDFATTGATDGEGYPAVAELRQTWEALQADLQTALERATEASIRKMSGQEGPHGKQSVLDICMEMALSLGPEVFMRQSRALRDRPDQQQTLRNLDIPVLVLCGAEDRLCPVERHQLMHDLIPASSLVVIENAGHMPTLEQPEKTTEALRTWLEQ